MSDIKFETINGTLCRMVEPTPLTQESTFPCVVRLIQDNSLMGRTNKMHRFTSDCLQNTYLAESVTNYSVRTNDYKLPINCYDYYEIIGYPVVEGSAEWGEYQTQQGIVVRHKHGCVVRPEYDSSSRASIFEHYPTGWQLYEPEPEFKVGDWVETNKQHHVEITEFPAKHYNIESKVYECYNLSSNKRHLIEEREIVRKLSPSEVIVKIGCLSGKVEKAYGEEKGPFILRGQSGQRNVLWPSMLDAPTRSLVESLLKAQKEEK